MQIWGNKSGNSDLFVSYLSVVHKYLSVQQMQKPCCSCTFGRECIYHHTHTHIVYLINLINSKNISWAFLVSKVSVVLALLSQKNYHLLYVIKYLHAWCIFPHFRLMKSIKGPVVITIIKVLAADCLVLAINQICASSDGLGMHRCFSSLHKTIKLCAGNDERQRNGFSSRVGWAQCVTQVNMPAHLIAYFVGNWLFNFTLVLEEWVREWVGGCGRGRIGSFIPSCIWTLMQLPGITGLSNVMWHSVWWISSLQTWKIFI